MTFWTAAARCRFSFGSLLPKKQEFELQRFEFRILEIGNYNLKAVQQQAVGRKAAAGCRSPKDFL